MAEGNQTARHHSPEIILDIHRGSVQMLSIGFGLAWSKGDVSCGGFWYCHSRGEGPLNQLFILISIVSESQSLK